MCVCIYIYVCVCIYVYVFVYEGGVFIYNYIYSIMAQINVVFYYKYDITERILIRFSHDIEMFFITPESLVGRL